MKIRSIALSAISVLPICLVAASSTPLAIYYSFDSPPSAALVTEMQAEVDRILGDSGVRVAWRAEESRRNGEDFPGLVFLRFRGVCSSSQYPGDSQPSADPSGKPLAQTDVADGHTLPFSAVNCDAVRRFIAPVLKALGPGARNACLGRAMARVSAHEIYHMLTGSQEHARRGIARAAHTRADLTAPAFNFAQPQTDWLRAWAAKSVSPPAAAAAGMETAQSTASDTGASAGR
jgi:hypothetical protein